MTGRALVTGCAGFIGSHIVQRLLREGHSVVGVDDLSPTYDPQLKSDRLARLAHPNFRFIRADIADPDAVDDAFCAARPDWVLHFAAQAGVRAGQRRTKDYVNSNLVGFTNVIDAASHMNVKHFVYASSSSVYGLNQRMPFSPHDPADHPVSLYAATKRSNELLAHSYSHLSSMPSTGLRFFTVYGPWGRPDMAPVIFAHAIMRGEPIPVFNDGNLLRDFTYIDDIVEGVMGVLHRAPAPSLPWPSVEPGPARSSAPFRIYNVGNARPVAILDFIGELERAVGRKATFAMRPMQPGDVIATYADVDDLHRDTGFVPTTSIERGIPEFLRWFREYYAYARPDIRSQTRLS